MTDKQIGMRLKQYRKDAKLTQVALAQKAGLNSNVVAKVERGLGEPTLATIKKLSSALGIKASDLLGY